MNVHCPKCKAANHADADICSMCGHWLKPPAEPLPRPDEASDVRSEKQKRSARIQLSRTLFRRYGPVAIGTAIGTCIGVILIVSLDIRGSDASTVVAVSAALGFVAGIFTMRLSVGLSVTVTALLLLVFLFFAVLIMDESRSSNVRRSRRARTEGGVSRSDKNQIIAERPRSRSAQPAEKPGLSEAQRKRIFWELVEAEDNSDAGTDERLYNEYLRSFMRKYRLSKDELKAIGYEGVAKGWPMP